MIEIFVRAITAIAAASIVATVPIVWLNADAKVWAAEMLESIMALFAAGAGILRDHAVAQRAANQAYEGVLKEKRRARIEAASALVAPCDKAAGESSAPAALTEAL